RRHVRDQALAHRLVVERVFDRVARRGLAVVEGHLDVEHERLPDAALPIVDADERLDLEAFDEDFVGHAVTGWTAGNDAISQRGCTCTSRPLLCPACRRSAPAKAIIAPLSVHSAGRGKQTRPPRLSAMACSFSRRRLFAPTPPATTSVSQPA